MSLSLGPVVEWDLLCIFTYLRGPVLLSFLSDDLHVLFGCIPCSSYIGYRISLLRRVCSNARLFLFPDNMCMSKLPCILHTHVYMLVPTFSDRGLKLCPEHTCEICDYCIRFRQTLTA